MPHVFISYRSEAQAHALEYARLLEEAGIPCWIACRDIPVGRDYIDEIPQAIEDCNFFLLLLSPNVHTSPWVKSEVKQAISDGKLILPLQLEPFTLDRGFHFMTRNYQIYHMYDQTRNVFEEVIRVIAREYPQAQPKAAPKRHTSIPAQRIRCPVEMGAPYDGDAPYIFISYSHKDADYVLPIIRALQERGFRIWYDAGMLARDDWAPVVARKIKDCQCFLPFLSRNYDASSHCKVQLTFSAKQNNSTLICSLEKFQMSDMLDFYIGNSQLLNLYLHTDLDVCIDLLSKMPILSPCKAEQ